MHRQRMIAVGAMAVGLLVAALVSPALATPVRIDSGNSWARIDPYSSAGHDIWVVDGWNFLWQQAFWYRVEGTPGGETALAMLDPAPFVFATDTDGDTLNDNLRIRYTGSGLTIEVNYGLLGGSAGSFMADMMEGIRITNTSTATQTLHFFQYADFILSADEDTAEIIWPNTARQWFDGVRASETVTTPTPAHYQVGLGTSILDALSDALPTTLTDDPGPVTGDAAWAFQWTVTLAPRGSYIISADKSLTPIPEPATLGLLGLGLGAIAVRRRRH